MTPLTSLLPPRTIAKIEALDELAETRAKVIYWAGTLCCPCTSLVRFCCGVKATVETPYETGDLCCKILFRAHDRFGRPLNNPNPHISDQDYRRDYFLLAPERQKMETFFGTAARVSKKIAELESYGNDHFDLFDLIKNKTGITGGING
jgi:hypothetical protein